MNIAICGTLVIVESFVEGKRVRPLEPKAHKRDDDAVLAEAICILHEESEEAAEKFLDRWAQRNRRVSSN